MKFLKLIIPTILVFSLFLSNIVYSKQNSWSNWLGPNYNGALDDLELAIPPGGSEYTLSWSKRIGSGWSSPIISAGSVYLHDRQGEEEIVHCLNLETGEESWKFAYSSSYSDDFGMSNGPRSTPAFANGKLVIHGPQGLVHCLSTKDGKLIWKRDLKKDFLSPKGFFGRCSSPLILDEKVIFDVGGPQSGLVALSLKNGSSIWQTKSYGNDYSSPIPFKGKRSTLCLAFMREGFLVVDSSFGKQKYFSPFRSSIGASVNAVSPLVVANKVFLSSCYGVGAGLWEIIQEGKGGEYSFREVWRKRDILDCHFSTPICNRGYLFGFHGRQERGPVLRCVRLEDGSIQWEKNNIGTGNLIRIKNNIISVTENGELIIFNADFSQFKLLHSQQILGSEVRSHFSISDQFLVARDKSRLVCFNLDFFN